MFTIHGGKTSFTQWALNEMLLNPHMNVGDEIRFRNRTGETCICYAYNKDGETVVNVPNELLQEASPTIMFLLKLMFTPLRIPVVAFPKAANPSSSL